MFLAPVFYGIAHAFTVDQCTGSLIMDSPPSPPPATNEGPPPLMTSMKGSITVAGGVGTSGCVYTAAAGKAQSDAIDVDAAATISIANNNGSVLASTGPGAVSTSVVGKFPINVTSGPSTIAIGTI